MTIRELLRVIWAGKYYVALSVLFVLAGALFYVHGEKPQYEATSTVQLTQSEVLPGASATSSVTVNPEPAIVTSTPVAEQAAKSLTYSGQPSELSSAVSADYDTSDQTMDITAKSGDPSAAVSLANAFANAYVAYLPTVLKGQIAELDAQRQAQQTKLDETSKALAKDPKDPLALAEQASIITTYQAILTVEDAYNSISPPGKVLDPAIAAVALGFSNSTVIGIAVLAGLIAGVGLALARRALDPRVRSTGDAADAAGAQVLAELFGVATAQKEARRNGVLPISSRAASPFTESIRELRTAVQVSLPQAERKVIVVTAADPDAPRSFIAANLAASWALSGVRTVAFSGDMRRPQLEEFLPAPTDWVGGASDLRPTTVPNLSLFPVQDQGMDPADFLATAGVDELVKSLANDADVLVIDAPPVLAGADATILGGYADGVVLIASLGRTDRLVLKEAAERLTFNNVRLFGLAVAGVKGDRRMLYATTYGEAAQVGRRGNETLDVDSPDLADAQEGLAEQIVPDNWDGRPEHLGQKRDDSAPETPDQLRRNDSPSHPQPDLRLRRLGVRRPSPGVAMGANGGERHRLNGTEADDLSTPAPGATGSADK